MKITAVFLLTLVLFMNSFGSALIYNKMESASTGERILAGTITDKNHKFITNLRVIATEASTKKRHKTKTNERGYFEFGKLPLGTYTLKIEGKKGFLPKTVENIEIGLNGGVMYNTTLDSK